MSNFPSSAGCFGWAEVTQASIMRRAVKMCAFFCMLWGIGAYYTFWKEEEMIDEKKGTFKRLSKMF